MDMGEIEGCIQAHLGQMLTVNNRMVQKAAATQVALHTSQWLNIVRDDSHPQWPEMLDILSIALKIIADDGGDFLNFPDSPCPTNPYSGLQVEWADMLRKNLRGILEIVVEEMLVKVKFRYRP